MKVRVIKPLNKADIFGSLLPLMANYLLRMRFVPYDRVTAVVLTLGNFKAVKRCTKYQYIVLIIIDIHVYGKMQYPYSGYFMNYNFNTDQHMHVRMCMNGRMAS